MTLEQQWHEDQVSPRPEEIKGKLVYDNSGKLTRMWTPEEKEEQRVLNEKCEARLKELAQRYADERSNKAAKPDMVNKPPHYTKGKIECIAVIKDQDFGFCDGNALKYLWRYRWKGKPVEDLRKAIFYIEQQIQVIETLDKAALSR